MSCPSRATCRRIPRTPRPLSFSTGVSPAAPRAAPVLVWALFSSSFITRFLILGSAKSLLKPGIVAYRGEIVVCPCLLAERREQLRRPPEVAERRVVDLARARREAGVVVVE